MLLSCVRVPPLELQVQNKLGSVPQGTDLEESGTEGVVWVPLP